MEETKEKQLLQWHPAFFSGMQIELEDYAENLEFENEHQVGKKPKELDILIIKKDTNKPIRKNIGRIFRKYNIVEYKSPTDYLNVDDFYKVYGYACFFKSDAIKVNQIKIEEITISLVCHGYPRKLIKHLKHQGYEVNRIENGIYYIEGGWLPIQLILTSRLSKKENRWLKCLTNRLKDPAEAEELITEYEKHRDDRRYESVMDLIARANKEIFQEVKNMCDALYELIADEVEEKIKVRVEERLEEKTRTIVTNMLKRGMSDEDICALAECSQDFLNQVRQEIF